ncbi:MAG: hypothetical protein AMXMBFR76_02270 [Pseudomonadota bacterium]
MDMEGILSRNNEWNRRMAFRFTVAAAGFRFAGKAWLESNRQGAGLSRRGSRPDPGRLRAVPTAAQGPYQVDAGGQALVQ